MNNLPKVVAQQRRGQASNPRLLDRKSDALPLSHRATPAVSVQCMPNGRCLKANKSRDLVEANLVIYSVTDRASFQYAQSCLQELRPAKRHNVVILVANKQDIVRNRVISEQGSSSPSKASKLK